MDEAKRQQQLEDRVIALERSQETTLETLKEILGTLKPLTDTYSTATAMGKWIMAFLLFMSILVGIVVGIVTVFKK